MANEINVISQLKVMREFKRSVLRLEEKLCPLDQLVYVATVASNREDEVIRSERDRRSSPAVESLRKLNAMRVICKRWDEGHDDHDLGLKLKKRTMYDIDSEKVKSEILFLEYNKDDYDDHGYLGKKRKMVTFTSKKDDEDAVVAASLTENGDDDVDYCAFELRKRDDNNEGKVLEKDSPEGFTRKKHLAFQNKMLSSAKNVVDHSDLGKKRKMDYFTCKKENPSRSAIGSRRNYGIQFREPRSRSRTYEDDDDDAEDEEWELESKKQSKNNNNKGKGLMMYNKQKRQRYNPPPSAAHQNLPENFKRKIEEMGGESDKAQLVYQKKLYRSDIDRQQNRLSLPANQLLCDFLRPDEVKRLENVKEFMNITIIDPMCEEEAMCFKKWSYKENVKSYVLITQWCDVATKNGLEAEHLIQVWSFRDREDNLHLAIVKRDDNSDGATAGCGSSSCNAIENTSVGGGGGEGEGEGTSGGDPVEEDGVTVGIVPEGSIGNMNKEKSMEDVD